MTHNIPKEAFQITFSVYFHFSKAYCKSNTNNTTYKKLPEFWVWYQMESTVKNRSLIQELTSTEICKWFSKKTREKKNTS